MRRAERAAIGVLFLVAVAGGRAVAAAPDGCARPVYLTFDTGHMGIAPLVADVLRRQDVRVTFFAADEKTQDGSTSLGEPWAAWWRARAGEGHAFASHTLHHTYWRADIPGAKGGAFRVRASAGPKAGVTETWTAAQYCDEIRAGARRLEALTGQPTLPIYRAPGGKTSPALLAAAEACGYRHVGWSPAGFLGDELPSETASNEALLAKALRDIRAGDVLLAHLGIWSRKDAWAPAVLEPLIVGLKARGFCFRTLDTRPDVARWIASPAAAAARAVRR